MIIWQQFPTKTKKNAFATPCVQVLWGSGCKSTLPKQWDCLLGEGRVEVALCFNFWLSFPGEHEAAHSALPALGLPSVSAAEESSQSIARELCSPALCFSPKSDDSLLAPGPLGANPIQSWQYPQGLNFWVRLLLTVNLCTLPLNSVLPWKQLFHGN